MTKAALAALAVGNPDTGYFIPTPSRPLRKWPAWTLRPHFRDFPMLAKRWDVGGEWGPEHLAEMERFVLSTHREAGNGVLVMELVIKDTLCIPSIVVRPGYRERGNCAAFLDTLPRDCRVVFPEVVDIKLAGMLHRRDFIVVAASEDDNSNDDDWIPCHVRGFPEAQPVTDTSKEHND